MNEIIFGDCQNVLEKLEPVDLILTDIPFNTRTTQKRNRFNIITDSSETSMLRKGFGEKIYNIEKISSPSYKDNFDDFKLFLYPILQEFHRVLKSNGTLCLHADWREVHYCKIWLDEIFCRDNFLNEIIWAYDYGARSKTKWPNKHNTILIYVKDTKNYIFNYDVMDREPYMAPGLVGPEKAARGKTPTDVWWQTIVSPNGKEKNGYPTQKPIKVYERFVKIHSLEGNIILDPFAGSGTTGEAAAIHSRKFIMIDNNPAAIDIMKNRLKDYIG